MKKIKLSFGLLAAALAVTGCERELTVEAGYVAETAVYGSATEANTVAMTAYKLGPERLRNLNADFAASADEVVTFAFDSSRLDAVARSSLDTQVAWLKAHPDIAMTIVGHTDLVGSQGYNKGLGLRRARAVLRYLTSHGVSRKRLAAIESRGELDPVVPTTGRERRNRRAVTMVSGFARNYVGFGLDGVYAARIYDAYQGGGVKVSEANAGTN